MLSWKSRIALAAGTLALATWAGYRAECRVMDSAGNKPITFQSVVRRVTAPKSRTEKLDKLNELRHRAGRSELSPDEAAAAWKIIRAMTVEDVKACLDEIPVEPQRQVNEALMCMLFFRWGQLDPEAAAAQANQPPYKSRYTFMLYVATAWADRDPEATLRWAEKLGQGGIQNLVGSAAGKMLVRQDPAGALEKALTEFPGAVNGVAGALANLPGETEESRRATLLRLAGLTHNEQALDYYLQGLSSRAGMNPELAQSLLAEIDRSGLPDDRLAAIKDSLASYMRRYAPPETGAGALGIDVNQPKDVQERRYASWSVQEPDKAIAWAEQNGRADLVANSVKQQSMSLLRSNWQPGVRDERGSPYVKGVIQQYNTWRKLDAAAAEGWLKTMPADMRKHLSPSSGDATR